MYLTRHQTNVEPRWALDGYFLPASFSLSFLLELPRDTIIPLLRLMPTNEPAQGALLLPPLEPGHEVWASGEPPGPSG